MNDADIDRAASHRLKFGHIARVAHEANRVYCEMIGDPVPEPWDEAPEWQRDSIVHGVKAVALGAATTPEQSHQRWYDYKKAEGWRYGAEKDPAEKTHPNMLPYAELPEQQKRKDHLFRAIVEALTVVL